MAVVKYDVSNVEAGGGGEQPQPGLYKGKIQSMTLRDKKSGGDPVSDLEITISVGEEYALLWTYVKLPSDANYNEAAHGWKLRELTDALKLPPKGSIDTNKQVGKAVNVKVTADTNLDGEYRGRARNLFPPGKIEEDGDDLPESGGDDEPLTREELADWSSDDLKEELESRGLAISGRFSASKAIDLILDDQDSTVDADDANEGEGAADSNGFSALDPELLEDLRTDAAYYSDWETDDLASYAADIGAAGNVQGRKTKAKYIEAIVALAKAAEAWQDGAGEASGDGDGEASEPDDYDQWDDNDLQDEINTRLEQGAEIKISGRKTKAKMVEALRVDDKVADPF